MLRDMYLLLHKVLLSKSEEILSYMCPKSHISRDENMILFEIYLSLVKIDNIIAT